MNERLTELYKSCRLKETLASQEQYNSADILIGTEVAKFAELIIRECMDVVRDINQEYDGGSTVVNAANEIKEHFGVDV